MVHPDNSRSAVKRFFYFCRMEGAGRYMKIFLVVFFFKFIWGNLIFLGHFLLFDWAWLKLSQAIDTTGSLVRTSFFS